MDDHTKKAVEAVLAGELRLLDPRVRAEPGAVLALLDPEFFECGSSGRRWDRTSVHEALAPEGRDGDGGGGERASAVWVTGLTGTLAAPGLVHVTYVSDSGGRRVLRSSLWRETAEGWRMYFHQGTPTGPS
ncbi:DUF4440 domain-containing protein [Streptomyces sp. NPDC004609]|uniref:nuclear transport factor 2 family protein n=1 Tax=Streptomyces sp. NPDC004609 TaxID=3364704 RepID=UPI0036D1860A